MLRDVTSRSQSSVGSMSLGYRHVYNSKAVLLPMQFPFLREQQHGVAMLLPEFLNFFSWVLYILLSLFASSQLK